MADNWKKLIVALDLDSAAEIERVVRVLAPKGVKFKIGPVAFIRLGPGLVKKLIRRKADVFIDFKLYDIPHTMQEAASAIVDLGAWAFTVHTKSGVEALRAVRQAVNRRAKKIKGRKPLILGVTELTSAYAGLEQVISLAVQAQAARLDGVIASAQEAASIKARCGKSLLVVTPGIRNPSDAAGDQKRVTTAAQAFSAGADYIVVGRPIIGKPDYLKAAMEILK